MFPIFGPRRLIPVSIRGLLACYNLRRLIRDSGYLQRLPKIEFSFEWQAYGQYFLDCLDCCAVSENVNVWIEKSPLHVNYLAELIELDPDLKVIHMRRSVVDNVASYVEAIQNKHWPGKIFKMRFHRTVNMSISYCLNEWERHYAISERFRDCKNHIYVEFEKLVESPDKTLRGLCDQLEVEYDKSMLEPQSAFFNITSDFESWKANNSNPIGERSVSLHREQLKTAILSQINVKK